MKNKWIIPMPVRSVPQFRLFCFPYSGGSAQIFKPWSGLLPDTVEVCGIQYPGRGSRFSEPPITDMAAMVGQIQTEIQPFLNVPFAFFGHSLGGGIALDLAKAQQTAGKPVRHLFISGRRAAHLPRNRKKITGLPEVEFRKEVFSFGGTPQAVLDHPELLDLVAPILRADLSISEKYQFKAGFPLSCPLTAFGGAEDHLIEPESVAAWSQHSSGPFEHHIFPGGHFFIDSARESVVKKVWSRIKP